MKLVYPDFSHQITFEEGKINLILIEGPFEFRKLVGELYLQTNGNEGRFVLSHGEEILKIQKSIHCIMNPFDLSLNSKKILDKIYNDLKDEVLDTDLYMQQASVISELIRFIANVVERMDYPLIYNTEVDIKQIFKILNIRLNEEAGSLVEKIAEYIKINSQILGVEIFIFINLKSYLSKTEIESLQRYMEYYKINIVLIESRESFYTIDSEQKYVIDKDGCEIY